LKPLNFQYSALSGTTISSNGQNDAYAISLYVPDLVPYILTGGPFAWDAEYQLKTIHWHFGRSNDLPGTEHSVDGKFGNIEMHMFHYNKKYEANGTFSPDWFNPNFITDPEGVALVAVRFEVGAEHPELLKFTRSISRLTNRSQTYPIEDFDFAKVLPKDLSYFSYRGSITAPNCNQMAKWVVLKETLTLSQAQMDLFRTVRSDIIGHPMYGTIRPQGQINGRTIYSFDTPYKLTKDMEARLDKKIEDGQALNKRLFVAIYIFGMIAFIVLVGLCWQSHRAAQQHAMLRSGARHVKQDEPSVSVNA